MFLLAADNSPAPESAATAASTGHPSLSSDSVELLALALGVYCCGLLAVSLLAARKVKDEADYLVAGRRLPLSLAWGTLMATWFGAATVNAAAEASREEGLLGVILDPFACAATLVFAGLFFARPLWRMGLYTVGDFYRKVYGPKAEVLAAAIQVPSYFSWIALQYAALGGILTTYFNLSLSEAILLSAGVTMIYTMIGGMWSVTLTDVLQIAVALVGLLVLAIALFGQPSLGDGSVVRGVAVMFERVSESHPGHLDFFPGANAALIMGWIGAWATGLFGCIPGQDLQQRVFASRDENVAARACILAGILYLAFGIIPVTLGLASVVTDPDIEGNPIPHLAQRYLSPGMTVVLIVAVVSMIVSTATSAVLAPAALLGHNLLGHFRWFHDHALLRDRLCVVVVSLGGLSLAMQGRQLMDLLDTALSIALVALFVPFAMGLYGKPRGALPAMLAMSLGFTTWLTQYLFETVFFSMPDSMGHTYGSYQEFVAGEFPIASMRNVLAAWTSVPAKFYGFGFSVLGYFVGQQILPPKTDQMESATDNGEAANS